ncbi:MAG: DUF5935 domain-containing protein [Pacificimonas sp.]
MRDLFLFGILLIFFFASFRAPYFMALGYLWVDILQPQRMAYYVFNQLPVAMIMGAGALASFILFDKEKRLRFSLLQFLILLLVVYSTLTTFGWAILPTTDKWDWTTKALLFSVFLPMVFTTRRRIEVALGVILFSICAITLSGALKTLAGSSGYGSLSFIVGNNTGLFEGSILSTTALSMLPMLWWFYRHNTLLPPTKLSLLATFGISVSFLLVPIAAEARTGFVAMGVLAAMIWWRSKRKILIGGGIFLLAVAATPFVPQSFWDRMSTIETYQSDESASTRIAVWKWTWDFVADHPLGGGFDIYKTNNLEIEMSRTTETDGNIDTQTFTSTDRARAFHSSYFEMLGELGYPGFIIWISIVILAFWQSRVLVSREKRYRKTFEPDIPQMKDSEWAGSFGTAVSTFLPVYMAGSLFVGIAFQPAFYSIVALMISVTYLRQETMATAPASRTPVTQKAGTGPRSRPRRGTSSGALA